MKRTVLKISEIDRICSAHPYFTIESSLTKRVKKQLSRLSSDAVWYLSAIVFRKENKR